MADAKQVLKLIKDKEVKFVDLRFTDQVVVRWGGLD